ncbi:MAG: amidohydrolase family protein [Deltaproteobacteria bacterium]|jgi:cytosine/adenosine deaminase-related metal-dependent hydrolase|nr:amidohydrolase family protein [Deltaproteobacteria bacterium]
MSERIVVFAERVVTGGRSRPLLVGPAQLVIAGGRFESVEPMSRDEFDERVPGNGEQVVDLGDMLVSPAFINGHTHLPMAAYRGIGGSEAMQGNVIEDVYYRIESSLTEDDVRAFTRLGAYESLLAGVGTVWDHYYFGKAVAEGMADVGLTGVVAPTLQDLAGPGIPHCQTQLDVTLEIAGDQRLAEQGIVAALGPHASDTVSDQLWQQVYKTAVDHELPFHAHVAQSIEEYRRSIERFGKSPLARLHEIGVLDDVPHAVLVHGIYVSDKDLDFLDRDNHTLGFCPYSQLQFVFPAQVNAWTDAGLKWLVATDCAASNDTMNVQQELRLVAGLRMTPTTASLEYDRFRRTGETDAAEAVHRHRQADFDRYQQMSDPGFLLSRIWSIPGDMHPRLPAGVLESGALANLVVWDPGHPALWPCRDPLRSLVMCDAAPAIHGMLVNGEWIGTRGRFHESLLEGDYGEALKEANRRLQLLGLA